MPAMRYTRCLSATYIDHLSRGPLKFFVERVSSWNHQDPFAFDLQIREGDQVTCYHGTTSLLGLRHDAATNQVTASAAEAYASAAGYKDLMTGWSPGVLERVENDRRLVSDYLLSAAAESTDGHYRNREEGYWQNLLSQAFGRNWQPGMDWLIVDREAVVGFASDADRRQILGPIQAKYERVRADLQNEDSRTWGQPTDKGLGNECDFLAIGPAGELLCIELKHGSNTSGIYWGALQAAVYRDIFAAALSSISDDIKALVRQKVAIGLLPHKALARLPDGEFRCVVPVLAVADPNDRSACWDLLDKVMQRCPDARVPVVEIRNQQDPAPVPRL